MEPIIDAVKTNIFVEAGYDEIELTKFYGGISNSYLNDIRMKLRKVKFAEENHQFLPKNDSSKFLVESDQGSWLSYDDKLLNYSFLCHTGNPCIDSRIFRKFNSEKILMICKQTKHTIDCSELTQLYLKSQYEKWREMRKPFESNFYLVYILFSNKN